MNHRLSRRRARITGLGLAITLVALAAAGVAVASRTAVKPELSAMVYHASGLYYGGRRVDEPRSAPLRCFEGDISTVVKGSQWGAYGWSAYGFAPAHQRKCRAANGITILHKIKGRWYVLWEGSDGYPPTHPETHGEVTLQPVPRTVAKDLIRSLS
jgi:hypothetical protein